MPSFPNCRSTGEMVCRSRRAETGRKDGIRHDPKEFLIHGNRISRLAQALEGYGRLRFDRDLIPKAEFKKGLTKLKESACRNLGRFRDNKAGVSMSLIRRMKPHTDIVLGKLTICSAKNLRSIFLASDQKSVQKIVQTRNYFTHLGIRKELLLWTMATNFFSLTSDSTPSCVASCLSTWAFQRTR